MIERNDKPDDRAQVGIGTLIVFIAMVLVAAIAAGVLINTAGFLQQSAEESGQQAGEQVTNRLQVVNTIGEVSGDYVDQVQVTVKQAPGAANIDLEATIAQWTSSSGSQDITFGSSSSSDTSPASGDVFVVSTIVDDEDSGPITVLDDPEDRVKLIFDAAAISSGSGLPEGGTATIQLNTQSGGKTTVSVAVPETLSGASSVQI